MVTGVQGKFSFRYGRVEVAARLPLADWLRPAIWLLPENNRYGAFPASGEIDLMEATGNLNFHCGNQSRGVNTVQTNIHYGPPGSQPPARLATVRTNTTDNYAERFHIYELEWTEQYLAFIIGNHPERRPTVVISRIRRDGDPPTDSPGT